MRTLRLFAALFVATSAAFFPALIASPASATDTTYTLAEYNSALNAAQTAVTTAQAEVDAAQVAVDASAVYHETATVSGQSNVVVNGTFDDVSGWSNIGMGSLLTQTNSSIPRVYDGVLVGSYSSGVYVQQVGVFPSPTRNVTFSFDMSNNNNNWGNRTQADYYRIEFRTYSSNGTRLNYYNVERQDIFGWTHFTYTPQLSADAVRWDIGFRFADGGYWNGNFAGSIDNVSLTTNTSSMTPAYTTYDQSLVTVLNTKKAALATAQQYLANFPAMAINPPTNLAVTVDGSTVTLTWDAPTANLLPERYAIMWTVPGTDGWGIASTTNSITLDADMFRSTGGFDKDYTFKIRSDNDTAAMYSAYSNEVTVHIAAPILPPAPTPSPSETPSATPSESPSVQFSDTPTIPSLPSPEPSITQTPVPEPTPTPTPSSPSSTFPENSVHGIIGEGGLLELIAPITKVFTSIFFASYGTPSEGFQIDPTCHAQSSMERVVEFVLGRQIASVAADNGLFGDPCGGTVKRLAVIAIYGDGATPDTSTSPVPTPEPSPTPTDVAPSPQPSASDTPSPEPAPQPTPIQTPDPTPAPAPTPPPVIVPEPEPSPAPSPKPSEPPAPAPEPSPAPSPDPSPTPAPSPEPSPSPEPTVEPSPQPSPEPSPAPTPAPEPSPAPSPKPSPAPEPSPEPPAVVPGLKPNSPDQLSDTTPKEAPAEVLVPHVQVDKPGVENGGIEFFGTKSAPQVVGEDGKLTPPAPAPGSGDPIPPDAITTTDTFIGQPGGTAFNAPDIAVPVELVPVELPAALDVIPGAGAAVQAVNQAYVALANIGNDMSPITRKKAKKILVITAVMSQIAALRRKF